jgi:hypothetical protein
MDAWVESEVVNSKFPDKRLKTRFAELLSSLGKKIGDTIPTACVDWAATKAAYRFLSNARVDENGILSGHFAATASRFSQTAGTVLVLHDTTEFSFQRDRPEKIGKLNVTHTRPGGPVTVCGLLMHSSLVVTPAGLPIGLAAIKFWTREKFKGTRALRGKVNMTRLPIEKKESYRWVENMRQSSQLLSEPERCVHIGDRESDIFELFCAAAQKNTRFLIRTCVDRAAGNGTTILRKMSCQPVQGYHEIKTFDTSGAQQSICVSVRFCSLSVHPPVAKKKKYPSLTLTVIHAHERNAPRGRDPIRWHLITNLEVTSLQSAVEKLNWYALRWKIETYHKILKSGCAAEKSKLQTAERLTNLLAVFCIIAWRVFWLTMLNRTAPDTPASAALTPTEIEILDLLAATRSQGRPPEKKTVRDYALEIARIGGYLARGKDPPPGNIIMWRGLSRLTDIHIGFELTATKCG